MNRERDLLKQIRSEITDFNTKRIPITVVPEEEKGRREYTYYFSQREMVAIIDLYWNYQFRSGKYDNQGRQKIMLNVGKFRTEVAEMQIDIDVSNFLFLPKTSDLWGPWMMSRDFHDWQSEHEYAQRINEWGADLPKYGSCVSKGVGDDMLRTPIGRLMNTQNAQSLKHAATSGGYVIEGLEMTPQEMEAYPDWNLDGLTDSNMSGAVYERYGLICPAHIKLAEDKIPDEDDWNEWFPGISVATTDMNKQEKNGAIVFAEKIDEKDFPYDECHWQRQDGRWQGIGEMENQIHNQLATNISVYLRQKSMYWAAKRIFFSNTDTAPNNLAKEVEDGGNLKLGPGGQVVPINTQTQHLGDFNAWDQTIENAADRASFTYEAATGESPKAGTPFSLQVQLDRTLQKHYGKKRENFGLFLKRGFFNHQVDIFKKKSRKAHTLTFAYTDEEAELLREAMIETHVNDRKAKNLLSGKLVSKEQLEADVREEMAKSPYMIVDIPDRFYDQVKHHTKLIITGEEENVGADMQTMITFWQSLQQAGDPRAEKVLARILAYSGKNLQMLAGMKPQQAPQQEAPVRPERPAQSISPEIAQNLNATTQ